MAGCCRRGDSARLNPPTTVRAVLEITAWAAAGAYGLGLVLMRQPGRESEAASAFGDAIAAGHVEYSPNAAYDLGVWLMQRGVDGAEVAFRAAAASKDGCRQSR